MKVNMVSNQPKQLNTLDKNCLKGTDSYDYIDENDLEGEFSIDDNNIQLATIEACLSNKKAGMQIIRMRTKDKNRQEEILREFIDFIWNMNHPVLAVHVLADGSGVDRPTLERLGFVGHSGIGSLLYTLLNPNYMELVEMFATDQVASEKLTKYYDLYQSRKDRQLKYFEKEREKATLYLSECVNQEERAYVQISLDHSEAAINSLGGNEQKPKRL